MSRLCLTSTLLPGAAIDREAKVIKGVSVITGNVVAHGHNAPPFVTDSVLLQQVADAINHSGNGVRVRLTHAEVEGVDSLPLLLGKIRNARVEGDQVKADFHFGNYADLTTMNRLFSLAEEAPEDCGLSIVPEDFDFVEERGELRLRVKSLFAVDWVGTPAANPAGMFSKQQGGALPPAGSLVKGIAMFSLKQMEYLQANGLPEGATEDEIKAMVASLSEEQAAAFAALADEEMVEEKEDEEVPAASAVAPAAGKKEGPKPALAKADQPATLEEIEDLAKTAKLDEKWVLSTFKSKPSLMKAHQLALREKSKNMNPPEIGVGEDRNRVSLREAIPQAIALRAGVPIKTPHERATQLRSLSVVDMARHHLTALGVKNAFDLGRTQVVRLMSSRELRKQYPALAGAQGTDDFDSLLGDTINKTLRTAYEDAPSSWQIWARRATAPDFKTIRRAALSEVPGLVSHTEAKELEYVTLGDSSETYTLTEYKGGIRLTRQAIVNDDLSAFGRIPMLQASAAKRKEDDVAYAILTANGTLSDGGALFNATAVTTAGGHKNLTTSSGTAMSVTSLGVAYAMMFNQKGSKNAAFLELVPKFLLVPSTKVGIAQQLINSTVDPADNKGHATNPYTNRLQIVPSARLDAASTTAWYLAADPGVIDTVEVCFLEGEEAPVLSQETDFDTDDMKFKVRHTVAAAAIDFRGLYKNDGA